jgi:plasmid stabilization system protein ParE
VTIARLRPLAEADLVERTRYYRRHAGEPVGRRFFDSAIAGLRRIERLPHVGSPRAGELCGVPGLRALPIAGFPCGWFYLAHDDDLDVVRLLAFAQDLPAALSELEAE